VDIVTGYGQFCAIARALEVVGERWTLLIVRELLLGTTTFTGIRRGLPAIPRATLSARLSTIVAAGIAEPGGQGYRLTQTGLALAPVIREMARWATVTDGAALTAAHLDTAALTWDMQRRIDTSALPGRLVVLEIDFTDRPASDRRFWLHLSPASVDLCRRDTGAPVDLWLSGATEPITRWWLGQLTWPQLLRDPGVTVHGDRSLQRGMDRWFLRYAYTPQALGA